jgi:hypothetical protein
MRQPSQSINDDRNLAGAISGRGRLTVRVARLGAQASLKNIIAATARGAADAAMRISVVRRPGHQDSNHPICGTYI